MFKRVYGVVKKIPEGYVATYGQIANLIGTKDARKVGWALHANKEPSVPCHRVVNRQGKLAENFGVCLPSINRTSRRVRTELKSRKGRLGWDGWMEQKRRLLEEGIEFSDERHVNLKKHIWKKKL